MFLTLEFSSFCKTDALTLPVLFSLWRTEDLTLPELSSLLRTPALRPSPEGLCRVASPWLRCTSSARCLAPVHSRRTVRGTARSREDEAWGRPLVGPLAPMLPRLPPTGEMAQVVAQAVALWFNRGMGPKIQGFISGLFSTVCIDRLCQRESMMVTLSPGLKHQCTIEKTQ